MNRSPDPTDNDALPPADRAVADWLVAGRPEPSGALRERGREVVRNALDAQVRRRRAGVLLFSGTLALALASALAAFGT